MRCRYRSLFSLAVLAALLGLSSQATAEDSAQGGKRSADGRPNIVLIVADDLGYSDLGFQGGKDIPTPNLDALAKSGVRCTDGYVSGPYCSPTRAGLLTGRYQQRFGHEFNPGPKADKKFGLPLDQVTLATRLKEAGYATGMVGKWHLGGSTEQHPLNRGFDEFFGFLGGAHPYLINETNGQTILRGFEVAGEKEYLTDAFSREAVAYVEKHKDEPFFLYYTFNAVHGPLQAIEKYTSRFPNIENEKRRTYAGMLSAMDDAVGKFQETLEKAGIAENTLIVFISDNGGPTQANASNNLPLNGVKATVWEGGVRVPFVVSWPGHLPEGEIYSKPVIQVDLCPTLLAAAEVKTDEAKAKFDGVDLLPYLSGKKDQPPHDALYWRFGPQWAIRSGNYKLTKVPAFEKPQLFDLASDIGESKDLSVDKPELVKELTVKWQQWDKDNEEPRWIASQRLAGKKKGKAKAKANPS
jgi:arylsulfatase A-like enzyme